MKSLDSALLRLLFVGHFLSWWPVILRDSASRAGQVTGLNLSLWAKPWLLEPVAASVLVGGLGFAALWGALQTGAELHRPLLLVQLLGQAYFFSIHLAFASSFTPALWALTLGWFAGLPLRATATGLLFGWSLHQSFWSGPGWGSLGILAPAALSPRLPSRPLLLSLSLWALVLGARIDFDLSLLLAGPILLWALEPDQSQDLRRTLAALCLGVAAAWLLPTARVENFEAAYRLGEHRISVDDQGYCWLEGSRLLQPLEWAPGRVLNPARFRQRRYWLTDPGFHRRTGADLSRNTPETVEVKWKGELSGRPRTLRWSY